MIKLLIDGNGVREGTNAPRRLYATRGRKRNAMLQGHRERVDGGSDNTYQVRGEEWNIRS